MGGEQASPSCSKLLSTYIWPTLVVIVISFEYFVFMYYNVLPQFFRSTGVTALPEKFDPETYVPAKAEIYFVLVAFHVFFLVMWICFYRSAFTSPGHIPQSDVWRNGEFGVEPEKEDKLKAIYLNRTSTFEYSGEKLEQQREFLKSFPVVERKYKLKKKHANALSDMQARYCHTCHMFKPDRTHHCSLCNKCILRMDHHCPWLANCVGFGNYKYFLLFLLYSSLCCAFVVGAMLRRLIRCFRPVLDIGYFFRADLLVIIAWVFALFLCIAIFSFFVFHMGLVFNCVTTIEFREKRNSESDSVQHRWEVAHQKFDQGGRYANFLHIFGSPWMWLLPIASNRSFTDGTYFETDGCAHTYSTYIPVNDKDEEEGVTATVQVPVGVAPVIAV